jgi:hypothetical protein
MKGKLPQILFYIGLTLELLFVHYDRSALPPLEGTLFLVYIRLPFAIFALKVCLTKYTRREWLYLIVIGAFTTGIYLITGANIALRAVVLVAAMRDIEIRPLVKYIFGNLLVGSLVIVVLSFFNIGRGLTMTAVFRGDLLETRYILGFGQPNTFHYVVLTLVFLFMYAYQERLKLLAYVLLVAINYGLFLLSDSRTGFAICALAIVGAAFFYLLPRARKADGLYFLGMLALVSCLAFSVWAAYLADSAPYWESGSLAARLDTLLTTRVSHLYWVDPAAPASLSSWSLFSNPHNYSLNYDMGWAGMFSRFGIVPGLVFSALHLLLFNECRRQKDYMALVLLVTAAIYSIADAGFIPTFILGRNCLLFLFGAYWSGMLNADVGERVNWWRVYAKA